MPVFGITTVGANGNSDMGATLFGYKVTSPSTDITNAYIRSVSFYQASDSGAGTIVWGLYTDSGGVLPNTLISYQATGDTYAAAGGTARWATSTTPFTAATNSIGGVPFPQALSGSTTYWVVNLNNSSTTNAPRSRYDTVGSTEKVINSSYTYTSYPTLPADYGTASTSQSRRVSVYVTYYVVETTTITSDAEIAAGGPTPETTTINSNSHIYVNDTDTTINSNSHIYVNDTDTTISSDTFIGIEILSNAQITREVITSDAQIQTASETATINSNAVLVPTGGWFGHIASVSGSSGSSGFIRAYGVTSPNYPAILSSVSYYVSSTAATDISIIWALYNDDGNKPDFRIASQTAGEIIPGGTTNTTLTTTVPFSGHVMEPNTRYWLVQLTNAPLAGTLKFAYGTT